MHYVSDAEARKVIVAVGKRMYEKNYVVSNDGNLSVRVGDNALWCTPTGVCKYDLTEDMLLLVDMEGRVLEGSLRPSSELKMHLRVYRENPQVLAAVHAHPPIATAFACARKELAEPVLAEAVLKLGKVPLAKYATLGTEEVAESIAPLCREYRAMLLANHGVLTIGSTLWEAYYLLETVEQYAKILLYGKMLGGLEELSAAEIEKLRRS